MSDAEKMPYGEIPEGMRDTMKSLIVRQSPTIAIKIMIAFREEANNSDELVAYLKSLSDERCIEAFVNMDMMANIGQKAGLLAAVLDMELKDRNIGLAGGRGYDTADAAKDALSEMGGEGTLVYMTPDEEFPRTVED